MNLSRSASCQTLIAWLALALGVSEARAEYFLARTGGELAISNFTPTTIEGLFGQFIFIADGPYVFETVLVNFTITLREPDPDLFAATFTFNDPIGQTMIGTIEGVRFVDAADDWSGSGDWTVTGGTGQYASFTGGGSFTFGALPDDGSAFTSFEGDVVPAPGAATLLLAGGLLGCRRRTRRTSQR